MQNNLSLESAADGEVKGGGQVRGEEVEAKAANSTCGKASSDGSVKGKVTVTVIKIQN